jgi:1-acyl-sn-glycerol-3-phosphate acyltransferase
MVIPLMVIPSWILRYQHNLLIILFFQARICICPEGTRNSSTTLLPFKKGAFHVALEAQCPVQPVVVSKYHFLDHKEKTFNSGTFNILSSFVFLLNDQMYTILKINIVHTLHFRLFGIINKCIVIYLL